MPNPNIAQHLTLNDALALIVRIAEARLSVKNKWATDIAIEKEVSLIVSEYLGRRRDK